MRPTPWELGLGAAFASLWIFALLWVHFGGQIRGPLVRHEHTAYADILQDVDRIDPLPAAAN